MRESALHHLYEEVPHALAAEILEWKEGEKKIKIIANLYVERESQKHMVIGRRGAMLDQIRSDALPLLREWQEKFIDLRLHVKVKTAWRDKQGFLRELGLGE